MSPQNEPIAYRVMDGSTQLAIYQLKQHADNFADDQRRRRDRRLSIIKVEPLYTTQPESKIDSERTKTIMKLCGRLAEHLQDTPAIDDAIRTLLDDQTGDNAIAVIASVLEATSANVVPDTRFLQFLTDVTTAAGLLRYGKRDAGLAERIGHESFRLRAISGVHSEEGHQNHEVKDGHVYVNISGLTGTGKSAVAGIIEAALRSAGLDVELTDDSEKRMTDTKDYSSVLEYYKPTVTISEQNVSRVAQFKMSSDE